MGIVAPLGMLTEVLKSAPAPPPVLQPGQTVSFQFQMWHAIAIIPKDAESSGIKKASDVKQMGGRILTEPVGSRGSPMIMPVPEAPKQTTAAKKTN